MRPSLQRVRLRLSRGSSSGYVGEIREFLCAVAEGRAPVSPAEDARRDLEIVLLVYRALERGCGVSIPPIAGSHVHSAASNGA
jgi:predicted dehydrogenase